MSWHTILTDMQTETVARLESADFLSDIVVLQQSKGIIESDVETALGVFNAETGKKIGAVIIAIMPEITNNGSESPALDLTAVLSFQVITLRVVNDDTANNGSGKTAESLAMAVLTELHHYFSALLRIAFYADDAPVKPLQTQDDGTVSYLVQISARFVIDRRSKVATPDVSLSGATLTLTCATAGATIYYTTDGSYPGSANPTSIEYTTPFTVADGDVIRAGAVKTDFIPSDTMLATVSIEAVVGLTTEAGESLVTESGEAITPES